MNERGFAVVAALDPYHLLVCTLVTILMQGLFFVLAAALRFDLVTDLAGGSNFVVLAVLTLSLGATYYLRQILVTAAVAVWGIRLAGYLLYRVCTEGKDARFDKFERGFSIKFAAFWMLQAVWVMVGSLPVILLNGTDRDPPPNALDAIGWLLFVTGFVIETVADHEKFAFRSQPANQGRFCDVGLWGFSRHPNYFGEILIWLGIALVCSTVLEGWALLFSFLGPLLITSLLLFVSGIPILEKQSQKRYGHLSEYVEYRQSTSVLVPLPPGQWAATPKVVRFIFLFDWDCLYADSVEQDSGGEYGRLS